MKVTGSRVIVDSLLKNGVDTVFGYPGGAIMPLYDALYDAPLRHVLTVHEQGAVHAADGYARTSGKVGVCIATSGPGATNLVTGLATAYMDSSPVVAITGQVTTKLLGRDAFQEVDIVGITMPVTKHNFLVKDIRKLAEVIDKAFAIAKSGRPGPVLVDVPRDILLAETDYWLKSAPLALSETITDETQPGQLTAAVRALLNAERPVVIVGGGVKTEGAARAVQRLAEVLQAPVVSTLMGLGAFPASNPQFLGLTGMHGHKVANHAVAQADLVMAIGTRFNDRVTGDPGQYATGKTIIHLDVDVVEFGKNVAAGITLIGDLQRSLEQLLGLLPHAFTVDLSAWWRQVNAWRQPVANEQEEGLSPVWIMRYMSEAAADQPLIWVTDVGQHQMWAAQHLSINRLRSWVTSGGLGTMGFGMPAAVGAQAANRDKRVVLIAGDGGFKMTGMELYTAVNENLPVLCVILNNRSLGMVRQWQTFFFNSRYSSTGLAPFDFSGFAKSCGAAAFTASTASEFAAAFSKALDCRGPAVIIADIDPDCQVTPMIYPGQAINRFIE